MRDPWRSLAGAFAIVGAFARGAERLPGNTGGIVDPRLLRLGVAACSLALFDDIRVLPLLRSAAVVKGLRFPQRVRSYFETMMNRIGYQPLPAI